MLVPCVTRSAYHNHVGSCFSLLRDTVLVLVRLLARGDDLLLFSRRSAYPDRLSNQPDSASNLRVHKQ